MHGRRGSEVSATALGEKAAMTIRGVTLTRIENGTYKLQIPVAEDAHEVTEFNLTLDLRDDERRTMELVFKLVHDAQRAKAK
jgi:hypothetical protein